MDGLGLRTSEAIAALLRASSVVQGAIRAAPNKKSKNPTHDRRPWVGFRERRRDGQSHMGSFVVAGDVNRQRFVLPACTGWTARTGHKGQRWQKRFIVTLTAVQRRPTNMAAAQSVVGVFK